MSDKNQRSEIKKRLQEIDKEMDQKDQVESLLKTKEVWNKK